MAQTLLGADFSVLDGDREKVVTVTTSPEARSAILRKWSSMAHRMVNEIPDTDQAQRLWMRLAPTLDEAATLLMEQRATLNDTTSLQLILAILNRATHPEDPLVVQAARQAVLAVDPLHEGERGTAWWVLHKIALHEDPEIRKRILAWLDTVPSGKEFENALQLLGHDPEVLKRIETWTSAIPMEEWQVDRQRLAVRTELPADLRATIADAAADVILQGADKSWEHYWLPVLALTRQDGIAHLSPAKEAALSAFLDQAEPFALRLALWLRLLSPQDLSPLPALTFAKVLAASVSDPAPERPSASDSPQDRVHDLLLLAWMQESLESNIHKNVVAAIDSGTGRPALHGKAAVRQAALWSLAMRSSPDLADFLHSQARRILGPDGGRSPLRNLEQSSYGQAWLATVAGLSYSRSTNHSGH